ncbi:glutathionylspermidine synthase family protein [Vibrio tritonius]|uniref:glutathionylspermidine synthase family protein n=1 Tax=Vibrio tritonius TaxID=1435069 RepID=UPI00315C7A4F
MFQIATPPRVDWKETAREYGFGFHTIDGEPYWTEDHYYQFSLKQIENDLEDPTEALHQMSLKAVERVVNSDELLRKFQIPESMWSLVRLSWQRRDPSLYSRLDFAYDGKSPAKLLELNSDTPTSVFELGLFSWIWLEQKVDRGDVPRHADQFNLLQDLLVARFRQLKGQLTDNVLHFCCCKETEEDRGTVQYLQDCAEEAGLETSFVYVEDIGISTCGQYFTDLNNKSIDAIFKLYPWEFMLREEFSKYLHTTQVQWFEPLWKCITSNKAILPLLWDMFPGHPNLLEAYFEDDPRAKQLTHYVRKPIFSREGSNVSIHFGDDTVEAVEGPYGEEGFIIQAYHPLPRFNDHHVLIGSWLVDEKAAGITIREDVGRITKDTSLFVPHVIW